MILVTGAAGKTGKAVINALAQKGASVRALVRNPEHAGALMALGAAEISVGEFEDIRALADAMRGVAAVYHICPNVSTDEVIYGATVILAAQRQGVQRFVYHSVLHPQISEMPHHWDKVRVENMLWNAGFELTVLQPTAYMQNLLGAWPAIVADGVFRVPYPVGTRLSLVDVDDVGAVAAQVLLEKGHGGATYELVGTPPLMQSEVAAAIAAVLGRDVRAEAETVDEWEARASADGIWQRERARLVDMFRYYAEHGLIGNSNTLTWLLGRAPTSLPAFLQRIAEKTA